MLARFETTLEFKLGKARKVQKLSDKRMQKNVDPVATNSKAITEANQTFVTKFYFK